MSRGGVTAMYGRLELTEAYALFLTSVERGDVTAAKRVVDAMPSDYYGVESSHLLNLHNGFREVVWAVERELLPVGAELRLLGVLRGSASAHAAVTGEIASSMYLCGVAAAAEGAPPDEAQEAKAAAIEETVRRGLVAPEERWGEVEVSVRRRGAAVIRAFDDLCRIVGVSADLVAGSHGLSDLPLDEFRRETPVPADVKTWSDFLLKLWFDEVGDVVADTPTGR